jgi:DNA repair exonuclease SbcCD ATPase subunit
MADQIIGLKINVDGKQAQSTVGSIRKDLKEANQELIAAQQNFGEYSQEALSAARKVAELRDRIGEAAETAALFDPGKKFQVFAGALNAVAGGFSAVQGALGILGVESEEVQKQLLKVQSALALSQGLSTIADSAKDFQRLKAVLGEITVVQKANAAANRLAAATMTTFGVSVNTTSVAFRVLKGAIAATGIGLLVVAIGSVVEAFSTFESAATRAAKAQKDFNESTIKGAQVGLKTEIETIERRTKLLASEAKARGASAEEVARIENDALILRRNSYQRYYDEINKLDTQAAIEAQSNIKSLNTEIQIQENLAAAARLEKKKEAEKKAEDQRKQTSEQVKQQTKDANKQLADLEQQNELNKIADEQQRAIRKIELDKAQFEKEVAALKINEKIKARLIEENAKVVDAQIRQLNQQRADDEAKQEAEYQQKVADVKSEVQLNAIKDEDVRSIEAIKLKYQKQFEEIALQETESGIKQTELRKALQERQAQEIQDADLKIRQGIAQRDLEFNQKQIDNELLTFNQRRKYVDDSLSDLKRYYDDGVILEEEYNKQRESLTNVRIALNQKEKEAQMNNLAAYSQVVGQLAQLLGKNTAAGKAAAIAEATINTYLSASKAYQAMSSIPPAPLFGVIAAGVATAAGIKNVREIAKVQVPGGYGGGGAIPSISAPNISSTAPIRPMLPLTQTITQLPANTINQMGSANIRAYVVESDITSGQERIRRLNRAARLG